MLTRSLVKAFGSMLLLASVAACGGDTEETPATDTSATSGTTPAAAPAPATGGAASDAAAGGTNTALVEEGRQVFNGAGICMTCHGPNAQGTPLAPNLTDDVWLQVDASQPLAPQIEQIIREGVPAPVEHPAPMPPMGGATLNDQQINALVAYITSL